MKKTVIFLAIAFLITAIFISGCQPSADNTVVVTSDQETTESVQVSGEYGCTDSDDGKDKETKGTVTGVDIDGNAYEHDDFCVETWLVEYYCDGDKQMNQNFICDNDCKNGACI